MDKLIARFTNPANNVMTVIAADGKTGINVKASVKVSKDTKAVTVARQKVATEAEAKKAFISIVTMATEKGWVKAAAVRTKTFVDIPDATAALTGGKITPKKLSAKKAKKSLSK